ncbi:MAG TPA: glycosyl transferase family 1 [Clostridiales bacterium]|nr:glycosyl transferase family 1 [Clostridiales bacterium]
MRIAVVNSMVPFVYGGSEFLIDSLVEKLNEYGHDARAVLLPVAWASAEEIEYGMMGMRLTKLENTDKMIAIKFPVYYIEHPNKTLWMVHQFRQAYDLEGTEYNFFTQEHEHQKLKRAVMQSDNANFKKLKGNIYVNSQVTADRLKKFNGFDAKVLFPPLMDARRFYCDSYGDYAFYVSRVNHIKRQYVAVEAMRYVKSGVKLLLAGKGDIPEEENRIHRMIEEYGLSGKVTYLDRFVSQQEKADYLSKALCGLYLAYDEDSYGYVTLECMHAKKPMITFTDSGGTDVVVHNDRTGYMVEPTPEALAEALDNMYENRKKTIEMGENCMPLLEELGITWENVIGSLTK